MPCGQGELFESKWHELLTQLPQAELRSIDVHQLKILVHLIVQSDRLAEELAANLDARKQRLFLQTAQQINRMSAQFGLSISDRRNLNLDPTPPTDSGPFEELMHRLVNATS